ncbi:carboxymuconolactone decarboxylase family protein [Novosphingobium sp. 1949]|uniref:Carboxymuconolactone decarboxylase family protein n=1 Tax=Novosphingobium organovorum TaxID=2930092 RepID=A0ABT0BGI4_9SPHN|nr:carboxymuconolactone decarboxylase family protein [Novosphingobium organovorum]MCJ2184073.1 carboxymuconolactone decarboxylase family protein [Novosphingobium organovorum]
MRLAQLDHTTLTGDDRALYQDMKSGIEKSFKGFVAIDANADLVGPWNPWLSFPKFGKPVWELVKALADAPTLPGPVREIAILVTGAVLRADYELYAHIHVAEIKGLADDQIRAIVCGQRPTNLTREQGLAYDFASALAQGGEVPELVYRQASATFGQDGAAEFIYLVGLYAMVCVTLSGFKVPVPTSDYA